MTESGGACRVVMCSRGTEVVAVPKAVRGSSGRGVSWKQLQCVQRQASRPDKDEEEVNGGG